MRGFQSGVRKVRLPPAQKKLQFDKRPALFDNKHAVKAQLFLSDYINRKI